MRATAEIQTSPLIPDSFLGDVFGFPCFRVAQDAPSNALADALSNLGPKAFVWGQGDADTANALRALGFIDATGGVTYQRAPAPMAHTAGDFSVTVIPKIQAAMFDHLAPAVGDLAARALTTSRFHADPNIPDQIAADIKRRWAMNFFEGHRGDAMMIARAHADDKVIGFNQVLFTSDGQVIDLICVDGDYRGLGIGQSLISAMDTKTVPTKVGSQIDNAGADAFYRRLGFIPVGTTAYMHWHGDRT